MDTLSYFDKDLLLYLQLDPDSKYSNWQIYVKLKSILQKNKSGYFIIDDKLSKVLQCGFPNCNSKRLKYLIENKRIEKVDEDIIKNLETPVTMIII